MKYINRDLKGTFGYLRKQSLFEILITIVLFAMAIGIYIIGYINLKTNKSIWSIIAMLALLPACKSFVGVIMLLLNRSLSNEEYLKYKDALGNISAIFENVVTTSQKSYFLPVIACENNNLIAYMKPAKNHYEKDLKAHLEKVLSDAGHKSVSVKIYTSPDDFIKRAEQMNANFDTGNRSASTQDIFNTIKAVSL